MGLRKQHIYIFIGRRNYRNCSEARTVFFMMYLLVSAVMGPAAQGLAGPRLLSEEEDDTEPLRAETALWPPLVPEATHCDCLHAARVACRDDLSGKAILSIPTTFRNIKLLNRLPHYAYKKEYKTLPYWCVFLWGLRRVPCKACVTVTCR